MSDSQREHMDAMHRERFQSMGLLDWQIEEIMELPPEERVASASAARLKNAWDEYIPHELIKHVGHGAAERNARDEERRRAK